MCVIKSMEELESVNGGYQHDRGGGEGIHCLYLVMYVCLG